MPFTKGHLMTNRNRGRRRLATVAVPMAAGLLLAACGGSNSGGGSSNNGQEPQTITFAFGSANPGEHHYQDIAAAYEKAHPGVKINIQKLPGESYSTAIATRVQGGNAPDVFQAESGSGQAYSVGGFARANLLLKLTDPAVKSALPQGEDPSQFMYNNEVVAVPIATAVNGIVYNDDLAKQNGVHITATSTLDDIINQCAAAKAKGKAVLGLAGAIPANPGLAVMELAASTVYGPAPDWDAQRKANKVTFAGTPGWKTALESLKRLYDGQCFQPGAAGAGFDALTNGAGQGKIFGFVAPSGAAKSIMEGAGGKVKLVVLPIPAPAGTKTYLSVSSDTVVAGSAKTKSPKLVADFLKYFQSADGQKVIAEAQGTIPVNSSGATQLLPQYAPVEQMIKNKDTRGLGTINWPNGKVYDALGSGATGVLTGQKTADDVLKQMDSAWR
jgi:raffinose/stachyose/melibiose transport system substrate-binding protein